MENLYQNARKAREAGNVNQVLNCYKQILSNDPNSWEASFYLVYYTALQQYRNDKTGSAIATVHDCIEDVMCLIRDHIQDEAEQKNAATEVALQTDQICDILYDQAKKEWRYYGENVIRPQIGRGNNRQVDAMIDENNGMMHAREIAITKTYASLGFKVMEIFWFDSELEKTGISMIDKALELIRIGTIQGGKNSRERKELKRSYKNQVASLREEAAKRRYNAYWIVHQPEKEALEAEKKSLNDQINTLNQEISVIPENTEGYADMVELQKKVNNLSADKKALGFFKFKDKKAIQIQIDATKNEIAPIQARINYAIGEVKKLISPLESRIKEIDTEFAKPR